MEILPAFPQGPEQFAPMGGPSDMLIRLVRVKIPLGWITPGEDSGSGGKTAVSPDMVIGPVVLIVTLPPCPLVPVVVLIREPPVISSRGVVTTTSPPLPWVPKEPNELLKSPLGASDPVLPNRPR